MTDKTHMRDAAPHIETALRSLEMLRLFVANRENLSLAKRVPNYYNRLVESALAIQDILLTDSEYTERMGWTLAHVSSRREYSYNVTYNTKGEAFYNIDGMLPLRMMKSNVLIGRKVESHV